MVCFHRAYELTSQLFRSWASLGAFAVIAAVLVDPFLQAAVSFETPAASQGPRVPSAHRVDLGQMFNRFSSLDFTQDGMPLRRFTVLPDFGIIGALYDGFFPGKESKTGPSNTTPIKQTARSWCEIGNCVPPVFTTAAVCSRCNDISRAKITRRTGLTDSFKEGTDQYYPDNWSQTINKTYTSYEVSYGHIRQFDGEFHPFYTKVLLTAFVNTNYTKSVTFQDDATTFATFLIMHASRDFLNDSVPWEHSWPTATECGLYFCAKAYESPATNGMLAEKEVATWAVREPRSWSAADVYQTEEWRARPERQQRWDREHPTLDHTGERLFRSDLQVVIPPGTGASPGPDGRRAQDRFNITQTTVLGLQTAIGDLFIGAGPVRSVEEHEMVHRSFVVYPIVDPAASRPIANVLWSATDNLTAAFDRVAQRLTLEIRGSNRGEHGIASSEELHIRVRWGFLSLLVAAVALGGGYVVGVLVHTYRLGLPAWKESVYPTLAFAPGGAAQALLRDVDKKEHERPSRAVRRLRGRVTVGLRETEGGYGLSVE